MLTESELEEIAAILNSGALSWRIEGVEPLLGGIGNRMARLALRSEDGHAKNAIARRASDLRQSKSPGELKQEFQVLRVLGSMELPSPRAIGLGEGEHPWMVLEFLEGNPLFHTNDVKGYAERYAEALFRLHRVAMSDLGFLKRVDRTEHARRIKKNERFREHEVCDWLDAYSLSDENPLSLCHGDFWPGNVLWKDGEISAIIDWEECYLGEPLTDVGVARIDLLWLFGWEASEHFTSAYAELSKLDMTDLPYYDLAAALRPMANIRHWAPAYADMGRPDVDVNTMSADIDEFVANRLDG